MEPDEGDVDVIFEDSVLHQALMNCGFSSLETEAKAKMDEDDCQHEPKSSNNEENEDAQHCGEHFQSSFLARLVFSSEFLSEVHHYHRHQTLQRLMSSRILSVDDRNFLQDFVEEQSPTINPQENFTVWTRRTIGFLLVMTVVLNISSASSYLTPMMDFYLGHNSIDLSPVYHSYLCIAFINFGWYCFVLCFSRLLRRQLQNELLESAQCREIPLRKLEVEAWELLHLERKCLRLLRESELVARGFTLASHQQISSQQASGQRSAVDQLCPQLRLTMLTQNTELLAKIKLAVISIMKSVAMRVSDSDFSTVEDPPDLDMILSGQENAGDVVPIAPISKSVSLLQIYLSGCIRRLALCFYQRNLRDSTLNPFDATLGCLQSCNDAIVKTHSALQEHHSFYRAVHRSMTHRNDIDKGVVSRLTEGVSSADESSLDQLQHFYVRVNSLDLHLQSVLLMTRELSSALETRLDEEARKQASLTSPSETDRMDGPANLTTREDWSSWEDQMKQVKTSLDSVRCCYEECMNHLNHKDKNLESQIPSVSEPSNISEKEPDNTTVKIIPAHDPVIVDQVFEAETDAAGDSEEEDLAEWRRQRQQAAQNRAMIQEQRETMKRLRQELGAVVGHRAIIQREREERALARARAEQVELEKHTACLSQSHQEHIMREESNCDINESKDLKDDKVTNGCKDGEAQQENNKGKDKQLEQVAGSKLIPDSESSEAESSKTVWTETERDSTMPRKDFKQGPSDALVENEINKNSEVLDMKKAVQDTDGEEQNEPKAFGNFIWKKVFAEVHQPNHRDLKIHQDIDINKHEKENFKSQKHTDKLTTLERIRQEVVANPSAQRDTGKSNDAEIVPGISYPDLRGFSRIETKSVGVVEMESAIEVENVHTKLNLGSAAGEDTLSDSSTIVKHSWKRPAPPRVHKSKGDHYVTPVNLITVGYVLQGGDGKEGDDGDSGGTGGSSDDGKIERDRGDSAVSGGNDTDSKTESNDGRGNSAYGEEDGACGGALDDERETDESSGMRRRHHSSYVSKSVGNRYRKTSSKSDPGVTDARGKQSATQNIPGHICTECNAEEDSVKKKRMMQKHWYKCEQEILGVRLEKVLTQELQNAGNSLDRISDDSGPDPDLVGGLRFSPEDFDNVAVARPRVSQSVGVDEARSETWETGSSWLRRFFTRPRGPARSLGGLPLWGDDETDITYRRQAQNVSRHNLATTSRVAGDPIALARRSYSSQEIHTENLSSPWTVYSSTAPDLQGSYSDPTLILSRTPPSRYSVGGPSSIVDQLDQNADQWVKITHRKMANEDSEVEVIRQKEVDLRCVLALNHPPVPSPHHNSSFTRGLAEMAVAQAHRMLRSENQNILGAEERFGDDSSSDEEVYS